MSCPLFFLSCPISHVDFKKFNRVALSDVGVNTQSKKYKCLMRQTEHFSFRGGGGGGPGSCSSHGLRDDTFVKLCAILINILPKILEIIMSSVIILAMSHIVSKMLGYHMSFGRNTTCRAPYFSCHVPYRMSILRNLTVSPCQM